MATLAAVVDSGGEGGALWSRRACPHLLVLIPPQEVVSGGWAMGASGHGGGNTVARHSNTTNGLVRMALAAHGGGEEEGRASGIEEARRSYSSQLAPWVDST